MTEENFIKKLEDISQSALIATLEEKVSIAIGALGDIADKEKDFNKLECQTIARYALELMAEVKPIISYKKI